MSGASVESSGDMPPGVTVESCTGEVACRGCLAFCRVVPRVSSLVSTLSKQMRLSSLQADSFFER
jgi:hypothetical protein